MTPRRLAAASLATFIGLAALHAQSSAPVPLDPPASYPDDRTGLLYSEVGQGSGAIVRHPRIVLSCAHVVFDDYLRASASGWSNQNSFLLGWNDNATSAPEGAAPLRGYFRFSRYAESALNSKKWALAFSEDFVAHYSYADLTSTAPAAYWPDGVAALRSKAPKRITGYPGALYDEDDPLQYRLHRTPDFSTKLNVESGRYLWAAGLTTGGGNSGGPAWVFDTKTSQWKFAGILVSGLEVSQGDPVNEIGVVGVNAPCWSLVTAAIKASGDRASPDPSVYTDPPSFFTSVNLPAAIPDGKRTGVSLPFLVSGAGKRLSTLQLTLLSDHPLPSDLEITLRSPSGRNLVIAYRPYLYELNFVQREIIGFAGQNPNGLWTVLVRDVASRDSGAITEARLNLVAK